jgi:hypothetical protein
MEYIFIFFLVTHALCFIFGMCLTLSINKATVRDKGMCSCANVYTYEVVQSS